MKPRDFVRFYINGKPFDARGESVFKTVAEFLREDLALTGTKIVCAEGDCGACTILRADFSSKQRELPAFEALNACITFVSQLDGCHIVTVEGLRSGELLHPAQTAMIECHGSQCGFCTPGFVMAMAWLREKKPGQCTVRDAKNHLTGNLCRCTGYQPIIEAVTSMKPVPEKQSLKKRYLTPHSTQRLKEVLGQPIEIKTPSRQFNAATTLRQLVSLRKKFKDSTILGSATDLGVLHNKNKKTLEHLLSLHLIPEFRQIKKTKNRLFIGAKVTLTELRRYFDKNAKQLAGAFDLFASPQIKNAATLVGNVANASPIADTPPILLALDAKVHLSSMHRKRSVALKNFYTGYRKTALLSSEVITGIDFSLPQPKEVFRFYKNSQRKDLDISCVNAAVFYRKQGKAISNVRVAFGGVGPTPLLLVKTQSALENSAADKNTLERAAAVLQNEITPLSDLRGSAGYRRLLAEKILKVLFS